MYPALHNPVDGERERERWTQGEGDREGKRERTREGKRETEGKVMKVVAVCVMDSPVLGTDHV